MTVKVVIMQRDSPRPQSSIVVTGIFASLGGQIGATPLTARRNIVKNCVHGAAVILQVLPIPDETVFNRCGTGETLTVFPPVSMRIEDKGLNVPVTIADGGDATFTYDGVTTWHVS